MINLTYKFLNNKEAMETLDMIYKFRGLNVFTAKRLGLMIADLKAELNKAHDQFMELIDTHVKKDENGKPIIDGKSYVFEADGLKHEFNKFFDELMETEFKLDHPKLDMKTLDQVKLSPEQVMSISEIVED